MNTRNIADTEWYQYLIKIDTFKQIKVTPKSIDYLFMNKPGSITVNDSVIMFIYNGNIVRTRRAWEDISRLGICEIPLNVLIPSDDLDQSLIDDDFYRSLYSDVGSLFGLSFADVLHQQQRVHQRSLTYPERLAIEEVLHDVEEEVDAIYEYPCACGNESSNRYRNMTYVSDGNGRCKNCGGV